MSIGFWEILTTICTPIIIYLGVVLKPVLAKMAMDFYEDRRERNRLRK